MRSILSKQYSCKSFYLGFSIDLLDLWGTRVCFKSTKFVYFAHDHGTAIAYVDATYFHQPTLLAIPLLFFFLSLFLFPSLASFPLRFSYSASSFLHPSAIIISSLLLPTIILQFSLNYRLNARISISTSIIGVLNRGNGDERRQKCAFGSDRAAAGQEKKVRFEQKGERKKEAERRIKRSMMSEIRQTRSIDN